ncbi:MAG: hypothetical protein ACT4N4_17785 [Rhodospirillales bacterium]
MVAVAAIGLAASWLGFDGIGRNEAARVRSVLELRADWRTADLQRKILEAPNLVTEAAAFVAADDDPVGPRQMAVYDADAREFRHAASVEGGRAT